MKTNRIGPRLQQIAPWIRFFSTITKIDYKTISPSNNINGIVTSEITVVNKVWITP